MYRTHRSLILLWKLTSWCRGASCAVGALKQRENLHYKCLCWAPLNIFTLLVVAFHVFGFERPSPQKRRLQLCQNLAGNLAKSLADDLEPSQFKATFCLFAQWNKWSRGCPVPVCFLGPLPFSGLAAKSLATISGTPSKHTSLSSPVSFWEKSTWLISLFHVRRVSGDLISAAQRSHAGVSSKEMLVTRNFAARTSCGGVVGGWLDYRWVHGWAVGLLLCNTSRCSGWSSFSLFFSLACALSVCVCDCLSFPKPKPLGWVDLKESQSWAGAQRSGCDDCYRVMQVLEWFHVVRARIWDSEVLSAPSKAL